MDAPKKTFFELFGIIKSWFTWRSDPANVSRDFWMPDQSCRVCYECDAQFTIINRRHHCRLCGRIFCGKCTSNSVPVPSNGDGTCWEEREKIRVCNYCFTQWQQAMTMHENGDKIQNQGLSASPSAISLISTKSSSTINKGSITPHSIPPSSASGQHAQGSPICSSLQSSVAEMDAGREITVVSKKSGLGSELQISSAYQYRHFLDSDDEDDGDEYDLYRSVSNTRSFPELDYYGQIENDKLVNHEGFREVHLCEGNTETQNLSSPPMRHSFEMEGMEAASQLINKKGDESIVGDACEASSSIYAAEDVNAKPLDFENNGFLWLPPDPEDEEDEKESFLLEDDDGEADPTGDWGYLCSSTSFGCGESRNRNRTNEEHKNAVKNVVDEHFKALVSQLLQVENLAVSEESSEGSWLEIITSLSWEAATLLKPDTSKSGGMDPGGYVKVKCLASGSRSDSMVIKGVVCKKNVAHRRMTSKIEKPRLLILGGALEYQRVSNHLSSFDTLLQQEMDHLKMAVAKIDAHHPNILLVEKSVSRFAQEYLLAKDISLVLNIKRPLLERIARCTGAQILPSIDNISPQKLGYCEKFHVDRFLEEHGTAGQGGKKLVKTLMYFEGCPKPLGFTILLRGANGDELKKVKHVIQYGVFAAYHLALETSFLADEGASLPECPLNASIAAAFPDKSSTIERSISTIPGFAVPAAEKTQGPEHGNEPQRSNSVPIPNLSLKISTPKPEIATPLVLSNCPSSNSPKHLSRFIDPTSSFYCPSSRKIVSEFHSKSFSAYGTSEMKEKTGLEETDGPYTCKDEAQLVGHPMCNGFSKSNPPGQASSHQSGSAGLVPEEIGSLEGSKPIANEQGTLKEEFPPSPSDHQSILVSLSSRCVWKGTVCERSHLFRIKYYGTFDKPLGRFLRDHLFDQNYRCDSCNMPSEAHVHCYTHRQGTLTISVKKLPEFLLPGERDGKIWMWHRCLRCPRPTGFPPATQRIVMSDAAWGLSFGKFLELSFSNHAAASRVASCGHSLHRDCLRFYGFGNMVACFRYASIDVYSVYLPPSKLDFKCENQEWMQKEANEVSQQAGLLFSEVLKALHHIVEKKYGVTPMSREVAIPDSGHQFVELEGMLQKEKTEFEESLKKAMDRENEDGQTFIDILEVNRLRRQLLFQSYMWDNRLIYADSLNKNKQTGFRSPISEKDDNSIITNEIPSETNVSKFVEILNSSDPLSVNAEHVERPKQEGDCENRFDNSVAVGNKLEVGRAASLDQNTSIYNYVEPLESDVNVRRTLSEGQYPAMTNLSDTLDAAWTGKREDNSYALSDSAAPDSSSGAAIEEGIDINGHEDRNELRISRPVSPFLPAKGLDSGEESVGWLRMPFLSFYRSLNKSFLGSSQKLNSLGVYDPVYTPSFQPLEMGSRARLLLPVGVNDTIIPVYDDEPTSIISYALLSPDYHSQLSDSAEQIRDNASMASLSFSDPINFPLPQSVDEMVLESSKSFGSLDESLLSMSGSRGPQVLDPLPCTKTLHARVSFADDGGKVKYSVTCYFAKRFETLRRICCPSELDFIRSLSRCKKWGAQGGKSNVFFAKTLDDRFIIKQVTKTELESFIKFAPGYFKYLSESISTRSPTCLAKILGIYQVMETSKHVKGGKELKMDVLVMENLLFGRNVMKLYDLKGSSRSRYNPDSSGGNKVLLDQNLIEAMPTSPIFVGNKAKRLLERAVWNDTSFLSSIDVMDYSLLVGVDVEKHELVLGIIDFMRQYTWDKHLETWVKASGILGGPRNASPTVISPKQYKKRFRKAMTTYFLMVPDQWSPLTTIPSRSDSNCEENTQNGPSTG